MRAMKDSGIEWIGQIPQAWSVGKTIFGLEMPITDGPHETPQLYSEGIPFVSAEAVSTGNGRINFDNIRGYISQEYYEECCKKYIPQKEDIYMIKSGATTGKIAIVDTDDVFTIWSPLAVFRCNNERCISRFLFYTLQSDYYQKQLESKWSFGTQQNIGMRILERLLICYPTVPEQERIVDYLDAKCAEIDALIAAKEKTNALLKERRQSIIYEAVTKGLNPDAPMKNSDVFWIGSIPSHWEVTRLKFYASIRTGFTLGKRYDASEELQEYPYLRVANVQGEYTDLTNMATINMPASEAEQYKLHAGELLMTEGGDRDKLGRGSVWHGEISDCLHQNHVFALTTKEQLNVEYLSYLTTSSVGRDYFDFTAKKTTNLASTNATTILEFKIPFPSREEQDQIVAFLNTECSAIDELMARNDDTIAALKEYRQSIIYEAVTGKIEV